jgi:hypothetical protein
MATACNENHFVHEVRILLISSPVIFILIITFVALSYFIRYPDILTADIPAIFFYSPTYTYVQSNKIKGFSGTMIIEPADRFASIANWYLKTSKKITW